MASFAPSPAFLLKLASSGTLVLSVMDDFKIILEGVTMRSRAVSVNAPALVLITVNFRSIIILCSANYKQLCLRDSIVDFDDCVILLDSAPHPPDFKTHSAATGVNFQTVASEKVNK